MDSMKAFMLGEANRGKEMKVFDWDLAARLIKEKKPGEARAGLESDWEWTGGTIFVDGKPTETSGAYLASTWATPELEMDGIVIPCFKMESETPGWGAKTHWPESARKILAA
jgi:hypothetical protein